MGAGSRDFDDQGRFQGAEGRGRNCMDRAVGCANPYLNRAPIYGFRATFSGGCFR